MDSDSQRPNNFPDLLKYIARLEDRIKRLEEHLKLEPMYYNEIIAEAENDTGTIKKNDDIEFQIGKFWFAKVGVIALLTGIVFILTLPFEGLSQILPVILGYIISASLVGLSYVFKKSFDFLSRYLLGGALIVLYFSTLRLHFFTANPVLLNSTLLFTLVLLVVFFNLYISIQRKSIYLSATILTLGFLTAMLIKNPVSSFILIAFFSGIIVFLKIKFRWEKLIIFGLLISYFTHFLWFFNNPLLGNPFKVVSGYNINLSFLLLYFLIYTMGNIETIKREKENNSLVINTLINSILCYGLFFLISIITAKDSLFGYQLFASVLFITLSYYFWAKFKSQFSCFIYSIAGFFALSIAIIAGFERPDFFVILCWQSLLVVALALLYQSKFITVANFFMYLFIFLGYLIISGPDNISISFGLVALLSARIINWQKDRLELRTEFIRYSYLFLAFVIFPLALYNMVPNEYVSISWIILAIAYYILGAILRNIKYRWLALYTLLITAVYLLIIGIQQTNTTYKIVSFISLGVVLLLVSLVYSKAKFQKPIEKNSN